MYDKSQQFRCFNYMYKYLPKIYRHLSEGESLKRFSHWFAPIISENRIHAMWFLNTKTYCFLTKNRKKIIIFDCHLLSPPLWHILFFAYEHI